MRSRATRLTLLLALAMLGAVLLGSATVLQPAAAAKKPEDPNAYVITAVLDQGMWGGFGGSFRVRGVIDDRGSAGMGDDLLRLYGDHGNINILLKVPTKWAFTIVKGTGDYSGLVGLEGTYTFTVNRKKQGKPPKWEDNAAHGAVEPAASTYATYTYTLEGTVAR